MFFFHKKDKLNRAYVSEIDRFLMEYDKAHPQQTVAQLEEKEKYASVYKKMGIPSH